MNKDVTRVLIINSVVPEFMTNYAVSWEINSCSMNMNMQSDQIRFVALANHRDIMAQTIVRHQ
jgi:hypothetical protein